MQRYVLLILDKSFDQNHGLLVLSRRLGEEDGVKSENKIIDRECKSGSIDVARNRPNITRKRGPVE